MSDPVLLPRLLPSAISHHVGDRTASRGLGAARAGRVSDLTWDPASSVVSAGVADADGALHRAEVELAEYEDDSVSRRFHTPGPGGLWRPRLSGCDCLVGESCVHVAATLYRVNDLGTQAMHESPPAEWRSVLRPLLNSTVTTGATASAGSSASTLPRPLALRFDLEAGTSGTGTSRHHRETATAAHLHSGAELWLGMRPLTRGRKGTWIKGDLSWRTFEFRLAGRDYDPAHGEALTRLFAAASVERSYSSGAIEHLWLNSITSPLLWQSLEHARAAGVEFLPGAGIAAIELVDGGEVGLDLQTRGPSQELQVRPRISIGGQPAAQGRLLGASGVLDVEELAEEQLLARLAPLGAAVPRALRTLLHRRQPLVVPPADRETFLEVAYPQLRALTTISSEDGSVELPAARRPTLHLSAGYASGDRLSLRWSWRYHEPDRQLPMDQRHGAHRDLAHEQEVIAEAMSLWPLSPTDTPELLSGTDTARFTEHVLD
ncbi:MAG: ATP-dependent helicase, partial [Brachybacterium sp.]|nr:ATP-dependent helicase [Brachybacterium sp.]